MIKDDILIADKEKMFIRNSQISGGYYNISTHENFAYYRYIDNNIHSIQGSNRMRMTPFDYNNEACSNKLGFIEDFILLSEYIENLFNQLEGIYEKR